MGKLRVSLCEIDPSSHPRVLQVLGARAGGDFTWGGQGLPHAKWIDMDGYGRIWIDMRGYGRILLDMDGYWWI